MRAVVPRTMQGLNSAEIGYFWSLPSSPVKPCGLIERKRVDITAASHEHIKASPWDTRLHACATGPFFSCSNGHTTPEDEFATPRLVERNDKNSPGNKSPQGHRPCHQPDSTATFELVIPRLPTLCIFPPDNNIPPFVERSPALKLNSRPQKTSGGISFSWYSFAKDEKP